ANVFKQGLAAIADEFPSAIEGIRGEGLMLGLKCVMPNARVSAALREQKVLAVPAGDNVVRLLPPLVISEEEIRLGLARIHDGVPARAPRPPAAADSFPPAMGNSVRHFVDLSTVPAADLRSILDDAARRKARLRAGERSRPFDGKVLAMIFDKPSTRTR